ncbi:hypothetical protein ACOME3_002353 [Neoechinorhynchus agilis]
MVRNGLKYINPRSPLTQGKGPNALWRYEFDREMYERRIRVGPDPYKPRRLQLPFNYESELEAMKHRFQVPNLDSRLLKQALTDISAISEDDGIIMDAQMAHNLQLAQEGRSITRQRIQTLYRYWYPLLPNEALDAISDDLMSRAGDLAGRLGFSSLVRCDSREPPTSATLAQTLFGFIGAVSRDIGLEKAIEFVNSVFPHNSNRMDINELWPPKDADVGHILNGLLGENRSPSEPRLMWTSGVNTPYACYVVGHYDREKVLCGWSAGRSVEEADQMAIRDSIRRIIGTTEENVSMPIHGLNRII